MSFDCLPLFVGAGGLMIYYNSWITVEFKQSWTNFGLVFSGNF